MIWVQISRMRTPEPLLAKVCLNICDNLLFNAYELAETKKTFHLSGLILGPVKSQYEFLGLMMSDSEPPHPLPNRVRIIFLE